jgi:hypothetical protein
MTTVIAATDGTIVLPNCLAAGVTYHADYCIDLNGTAGCQFPADHQWRRNVVGDGGSVVDVRPHADTQTDITPF